MMDVRPVWLAALGLVLSAACSKREAAPAATGHAPEAGAPAPPPTRCQRGSGGRFALGAGGDSNDAGTDEDDAEFLPFSVELGRATATEQGFAVSMLRTESGGTHADLVLLPAAADGGRSVDLGRVYGDVEPPVVAVRGATALVAVADSNPNARRLTLMKLDLSKPNAPPVRGAVIEPERSFQTHDLELTASRALVVWDQPAFKAWPAGIWAASVELGSLAAGAAHRIGGPDSIGEAPRLVPRPGGFWLVFVEQSPPGRGDAGAQARPAREDESDPLVDLGPRGLVLLGLDEQGKPAGAKLALTDADAHVLSFDVAPAASGGLVLVWRDETSEPGAEQGQVHGAVIGPDGAITKQVVDVEEVGAGTPSLLPADRPWLALGGVGDAARLGRVDIAGRRFDKPLLEPALRGADVLGASGTRLLLAHPRGMGVEFSVVDCSGGP